MTHTDRPIVLLQYKWGEIDESKMTGMSVTEYSYNYTTASKRVFYTIDGSTDGTVTMEERLGHEHSTSHNVNSLWIAHAKWGKNVDVIWVFPAD